MKASDIFWRGQGLDGKWWSIDMRNVVAVAECEGSIIEVYQVHGINLKFGGDHAKNFNYSFNRYREAMMIEILSRRNGAEKE